MPAGNARPVLLERRMHNRMAAQVGQSRSSRSDNVACVAVESTSVNRRETAGGNCARGSRGCTTRQPSTLTLYEDWRRTSMSTLVALSVLFNMVYILQTVL
jgi:hypothetical protein